MLSCRRICPYINIPEKNQHKPYVFGGYHKSSGIKDQSTSGGAFSAIAEVFCNENYVVFGAAVEGLRVYHTYTEDKKELYRHPKHCFLISLYTDFILSPSTNIFKLSLQKLQRL